MVRVKNNRPQTLTVLGVEFAPGQVKEIPNLLNAQKIAAIAGFGIVEVVEPSEVTETPPEPAKSPAKATKSPSAKAGSKRSSKKKLTE